MVSTIPRCLLIMSCILMTGCSTLCQNWLRTLCYEPRTYNWRADKRRSLAEYRTWADQVWQEEWQSCGGAVSGPDYAAGFHDGFVDFVYAGGNGEPPPVPPRQFWNVDLRSPAGKARVNQWFDGYRHGARVAREGGYREMATVQTSFLEAPFYHPSGYPPEMLTPGEPSFDEAHSGVEELPDPASTKIGPNADAADRPADRRTRVAIIQTRESPEPASDEEVSTDVAPAMMPGSSVTSSVHFVSIPTAGDSGPEFPAPARSLPLTRAAQHSSGQWRPSLVSSGEQANERSE